MEIGSCIGKAQPRDQPIPAGLTGTPFDPETRPRRNLAKKTHDWSLQADMVLQEAGDYPADMIQLTRINHSSFILNSDLIENVQATPDTVITLTNGHNYMVLEPPSEVIDRIVRYRRRILPQHNPSSCNAATTGCEHDGQ